jgi:hypothetical protein
MSAAGSALSGGGYSGMSLIQQVADETDEERRKRLLAAQSQRLLPSGGMSKAGSALGMLNAGYGAALSNWERTNQMTAVSLSVKRGVDGFTISDVVISNLAPNANDIELRFQLLDANSVALSREDVVVRAFNAFRTAILNASLQSPAGTFVIPNPAL